MMIYTVPENYRLFQLCIVGVMDSVNQTYTITAQQMTPPKAEGAKNHTINITLV